MFILFPVPQHLPAFLNYIFTVYMAIVKWAVLIVVDVLQKSTLLLLLWEKIRKHGFWVFTGGGGITNKPVFWVFYEATVFKYRQILFFFYRKE